MGLLLVLSLGLAADAAEAGVAYREGLDLIGKGRYDAAVLKFKEALDHEAGETAKLLYREGGKRRRHAYYPHFEWARARLLQAAGEKKPDLKVQYLREAVVHLGLTRAPKARAELAPARARLAKAEEVARAVLDPFVAPHAALQKKVAGLCDRELFVEASAALQAEDELFKDHAAEKGEMEAFIRARKELVVERYGRLLVLALNNLASIDPIRQGPSALPFLTRADLPSAVEPKPEPPFVWLRGFIALYQGELERVGKATSLDVDTIIKTAGAFDGAAEKALEAGSFAGFRAANHVALSMRAAGLSALADGSPDVVGKLLVAAEEAGRRCEASLRRRIEEPPAGMTAKELEDYLAGVLAARLREVAVVRRKVEARAKAQEAVLKTIGEAEAALIDPKTIADQTALQNLESRMAAEESTPAWARLSPEDRARSLLVRAIAEAVIGLLKAEPGAEIRKRCRAHGEKAFGLDGKAAERWKGRISPKVLALLEELNPQ